MIWKNWPTWLKGGLIALSISIFSFLIYQVFNSTITSSSPEILQWIFALIGLIGFLVGLGGWLFLWGDNGPPSFLNPMVALILGFILWFLIGAIIGWIVGKIKSKKKK